MKACENIECHDTVVRMSSFIKGLCAIAIILAGTVSTSIFYGLRANKEDKTRIYSLENKIVVLEKDTIIMDEIRKNQQSIMLNIQKLEDEITHEIERSKTVDGVIFRKLGERGP
jgi:hypothetical protein